MNAPTTFWRSAGMSYVQYLNRATTTLRASLKEPAKSKAASQAIFSYNRNVYVDGAGTGKVALGKSTK
eukprot:CAMPEP_0194317916 /NCGR_PEP_ID=MMETSP0171-20130528/14590_1 /TAXON_ID=218684 /ORGANISM="Corethron pennatum, Strain L29A3" /LENGTH=67 /DNA_ID=CAMNT_0039074647 /DNA_START=92 /DNA_END=295 /DNA_ORIENTATION=+